MPETQFAASIWVHPRSLSLGSRVTLLCCFLPLGLLSALEMLRRTEPTSSPDDLDHIGWDYVVPRSCRAPWKNCLLGEVSVQLSVCC